MDDLGASATNLRRHTKIPIYVVEYHHEVLPYIYRNVGSKHLPLHKTPVIHFDSHPDMLIPREMPAEVVFDKARLFESISIENWMLPAVYSGQFGDLIWVKPPWALQIPEGKRELHVGKARSTGFIRTDCTESYFLSECLYVRTSELEEAKKITLEVLTLGNDVDEGDELIKNTIGAYVKKGTVYVLDIDLDFFSTSNPFRAFYKEADLYNKLKVLYDFTKPAEGFSVDACMERREAQIGELEGIFKHLQKARKMPEVTGTASVIYESVADLREHLLKFYEDSIIDWELIHDAGCTCDDSELPHHVSTEDEIQRLMGIFGEFLDVLEEPPTIVTISRSTEDDYTPFEVVEKLQDQVVEILQGKFNCDEPILDYLDKSDEEVETK